MAFGGKRLHIISQEIQYLLTLRQYFHALANEVEIPVVYVEIPISYPSLHVQMIQQGSQAQIGTAPITTVAGDV